MGGDLSVQNNTGIELIVTLKQAGPLHWERVAPWSRTTIKCGQVWFTVDARLWDGKEPSDWDVAKPFVIGFGAGAAVVTAGVGLALAGPAAGSAAAAEGAAVAAGGTTAAAGGTSAITAGGVAAAGGTAAAGGAAAKGTTLALVGAGASVVSASATFAACVTSAANKSTLQNLVAENAEKWLAYTPSQRSAEWLAKNNVICVVPVSEKGVYADGKTVAVNYDFQSSSGGSRMTLKLSGT